MSLTIRSRLIVDTAEFSFLVTSKEAYKFYVSQLYGLPEFVGKIGEQASAKIWQKSYSTGVQLWGSKKKGEKRALGGIELGVLKNKSRYFRLVLQAGQYRVDEFQRLQELLGLLFEINYASIYASMPPTRLDFAVDIKGRSPAEFICHRDKTMCSVCPQYSNGTHATILGSPRSKTQLIVYDKAAQLKSIGVNSPWSRCTRVEVRKRKFAMPVPLLGEADANPFVGVGLTELQQAETLSSDPSWKYFIKDCQENGSALALAAVPTKAARKLYRDRLKASHPKWWRPAAIWKEAGDALLVLKPVGS